MPEPITHDLKPSTSTVASTGGAALAVIVLWIVETYLTGPIPAPVAASFATLATIGAGYFFSGGRSVDTK